MPGPLAAKPAQQCDKHAGPHCTANSKTGVICFNNFARGRFEGKQSTKGFKSISYFGMISYTILTLEAAAMSDAGEQL